MTPEELLIKLCQPSSARVQRTLQAIYEICDEQRARGVHEFSPAIIAKLGRKRGVPKAQSLRNKTGEKYRALMQSFSDAAPVKKLKKPSKSELEWIDEIKDPKQKLLTKIMASDLKETQSKLKELIPPNQRIEIYDYGSAQPSEHRLSDLEVKALKYLLSKDFKLKWEFEETEFGELVDRNGTPVFKIATIDAIKKSLEHLS